VHKTHPKKLEIFSSKEVCTCAFVSSRGQAKKKNPNCKISVSLLQFNFSSFFLEKKLKLFFCIQQWIFYLLIVISIFSFLSKWSKKIESNY
jgi:hypothetical protein